MFGGESGSVFALFYLWSVPYSFAYFGMRDGVLHTTWQSIPGRFKDYISTPKSNGYRSLHTTLIFENSMRMEVQIRTEEMHRDAQFGIASHMSYKQLGKDVELVLAGEETEVDKTMIEERFSDFKASPHTRAIYFDENVVRQIRHAVVALEQLLQIVELVGIAS